MAKEAAGAAGRAAIVTGGTRGIGRGIAAALAREGAAVVITGRDAAATERAAAELAAEAGGARLTGIACDVRDPEACANLVERAASVMGRVDVLVNNAGVGRFAAVEDMPVDAWRAVLETNLHGVFYLCKAVIPELKRNGGGWIINIGSLAGRNAFPGGAAYNASKFGLLGFTEALMQEVRHQDIRVSCVMPGSVATEFREDGGKDWKLWPEDVAQVVVDLLAFPGRALPSRVEIRPAKPRK